MTTPNRVTRRAAASQDARQRIIEGASVLLYTSAASTALHSDACEARLESLRITLLGRMSIIAGEYHDAGISGLSDVLLRPGIQAMMQRIDEGGIAAVIIDGPERFGRDPHHAAALVDWLDTRGVAVLVGSHRYGEHCLSLMIRQPSIALRAVYRAKRKRTARHETVAPDAVLGRTAKRGTEGVREAFSPEITG